MMVLRRAGILFLLLSCLAVSRGLAQHTTDTAEKLDTTVGDTIVVGSHGTVLPPGQESTLDTSLLADPGGTASGDQPAPSLRTIPDTAIDAYRKNPHFAYANDPDYWRHQREEPGKFALWLWRILGSAAFRWFILIALAGLLLFVVIKVVSENNLHAFYRRRARRTGGEGEAGGEQAEEDLEERLQHYLTIGDHRQAVRYLYLRSLRALDERGLIRQTLQATNHEYLRQLNGTPQERPFHFLTTAYEKVWYGEFALGETQFQRLYQHFADFDKTVRS